MKVWKKERKDGKRGEKKEGREKGREEGREEKRNRKEKTEGSKERRKEKKDTEKSISYLEKTKEVRVNTDANAVRVGTASLVNLPVSLNICLFFQLTNYRQGLTM